jgi:RND family efflux transporter MFP subunit
MRTPTKAARRARVALLAATLLAPLLLSGCGGEEAAAVKYHCPMHPTYSADQPGDCPICGMRLVPMEERTAATAPATAGERRVLFYRSPMDPTITSPVPAKDTMGMDFVPVYEDEAKATKSAVEGLGMVTVGEQGLRLAGVQSVTARRETLGRAVRTVGLVVPDERRVRHVHTKISGWIERLHANFIGQEVQRGQPLLALYSPELLATQEEFLRARETAARFAASQLPEVRRGGEELLAAARRRLELFDVPPSFIAELETSGRTQRTVTLLAPVSGFVTAKDVFEGQQVEPGMELYTITDLSRVWVEADFYEYEARALAVGQPANLSLPYDPGVRLAGRVTYVYPTLEPESRTLKVRLDFSNPDGTLRPGTFADVVARLEEREGIVVPDSAILDSGLRQIVFVERRTGLFEPREVHVASRAEGKALVLSGILEGERVAVRANFLLDSESRLRAAIEAMSAPEGGGGSR